MKIGLFDHVEHGERPLATLFDERLRFAEAADAAGIYSLHVAEHHATPLNMVPVPGVYLGAVARATSRMRLGPLVYLLPLYSPLRLIEEICMLDHLSHGRLEVGVGRGASPHELQYFGVDPETAPSMYVEAYTVIRQALTQKLVNFSGKYYNFENVPIEIKPAQLPHPPFWYAVPVPEGVAWPAQNRINIVCAGPVPKVREITDRYRAEWEAAGNAPDELPLLGINCFVIAADTDGQAMELGRRAWPVFHAGFMKLWKKHGTLP